jgi:hypothetical protein
MTMLESQRVQILNGLAAIGELGAKAEALEPAELLRLTLPIRAHLHALEPDILLIVGGRGAGKSHLFRVINLPDGPAALEYEGRSSGAIWLRGFSTSPTPALPVSFPGETVLQRFAQDRPRTDLVDFWRGLLVGTIIRQGGKESALLRSALPDSLTNALADLSSISKWHTELVKLLEDVEAALNRLDDELGRQQRYLFATYDDLDVMAVEWDQKRALIQALLQFWLGQWRRWQRIRPKIFLRRDLFSAEFLNFPDASKLEGNKLDLRWTPTQLYQLAFKLWANQDEACRTFLEEAGLFQFREDQWLGWIYESPWPTDDALRRAVHRLMGQFMGRGPKKGRTFEWIPNHLQDANGEIVPRSIINLFSLAAEDEVANHRASGTLLAPVSFGAAIEQVSERRIQELEEEYPWLGAVRLPLQGQQVPMTRERLMELLREVDWSGVERPPVSQDPNRLIRDMLQIGILRLTTEGRIHVPDIYLYGFGLKRKGGIRRPSEVRV